jgi:hypothetical protein
LGDFALGPLRYTVSYFAREEGGSDVSSDVSFTGRVGPISAAALSEHLRRKDVSRSRPQISSDRRPYLDIVER